MSEPKDVCFSWGKIHGFGWESFSPLNMRRVEFAKEMMATVGLNAAALRKLISTSSPESNDVENKVDDILGLTLGAFTLGLISEADFREILVRCLDPLPYLAR